MRPGCKIPMLQRHLGTIQVREELRALLQGPSGAGLAMTSEWVAQGLNLTSKPSRDPTDFPDPLSMLDCPQSDFLGQCGTSPACMLCRLAWVHKAHDRGRAVTPPASHSLDLDSTDPAKSLQPLHPPAGLCSSLQHPQLSALSQLLLLLPG